MASKRIVVLNPTNAAPTFGNADDARIIEMPSSWNGDGAALRKALDSGLLTENRVGKAVGKKAAEESATDVTENKPEGGKSTPPKVPAKK